VVCRCAGSAWLVKGKFTDEGLSLADRGGLFGLGGEPLLHSLLESLDLAAGNGVVGTGVLLENTESAQFELEELCKGIHRHGGQGLAASTGTSVGSVSR
jgi:hypothetical protein